MDVGWYRHSGQLELRAETPFGGSWAVVHRVRLKGGELSRTWAASCQIPDATGFESLFKEHRTQRAALAWCELKLLGKPPERAPEAPLRRPGKSVWVHLKDGS